MEDQSAKTGKELKPDVHSGTPSRFLLNVDLEIESTDDLKPLIDAFEPDAFSLERPAGRACFELISEVTPEDPERLILDFVRLVNNLPPSPRSIWDRASSRVFDVGLQSARQASPDSFRFKQQTLQAILGIGAEIAVTIYALDPADDAR